MLQNCVDFMLLSMLGKDFSQWHFEFFFLFPENMLDVSCKFSPLKTSYIKCRNLFSGKNQKIKMPSAELAQREVKIN